MAMNKVENELDWYFQWGICTSIPKFGGSRRSTRSKGTFLRTASHDNEDNPNQFETNKKLLDEMENHCLS